MIDTKDLEKLKGLTCFNQPYSAVGTLHDVHYLIDSDAIKFRFIVHHIPGYFFYWILNNEYLNTSTVNDVVEFLTKDNYLIDKPLYKLCL